MKLFLTNGYPYPFPIALAQKEEDTINDAAAGIRLEIPKVTIFEWKHTITVEFKTLEAGLHARDILTDWTPWGKDPCVLEAKWSTEDGYDHPAIIVKDTAYCGFMLIDDACSPSNTRCK